MSSGNAYILLDSENKAAANFGNRFVVIAFSFVYGG